MQIAEIASFEVVLIVVAVIVVVFGSSKIPKIARGLGSAKSEFEKGIKEGHKTEAVEENTNQTDTPAP